MMPPLPRPPLSGAWRLRARAPSCLVPGAPGTADIDGLLSLIVTVDAEGRIEAIEAAEGDATPGEVDLDGGIVLPTFVDLHTHLDKGHIWPRRSNPDGSFSGALAQVALDREACWTAEDVAARMTFALQCAYAHGTSAIRTHLDSIGPQTAISWPVFARMREAWAGRIALQAVALFTIEQVSDAAHMSRIRAAVIEHDGILGGVTYSTPELEQNLDRLFRFAADEGLDLDFHVDEKDWGDRSLGVLAETALRHRFAGRITVGHCCTLALMPEDEAKAVMDKVAAAGIAVVSLPLCNMYLQDRAGGRTPRWRGVTLLHELRSRGVDVAVASDNTRDPFYAYGDLDGLEVLREATRILQLDHPAGDWVRAVTATPGRIMGLPLGEIVVGRPADLVLTRARSWTELFSRPQSDRVVVRSGRAIDATLPDYRELDAFMATS